MYLSSRIKGFANKSLLGVMGVSSLVGYGAYTQNEVVDSYGVTSDAIVQKIEDVYAASLKCHYELSHWCTVSELATNQYYTDSFTTSQGTNINLSLSGDDLILTLDVLKPDIANRLRSSLPSSVVTGATVTTRIKRPSQSEIFSEKLARYENSQRADESQLETTIDFDGNNLANVGTITADNIIMDAVEAQTFTTDTLSASNGINLGANSIVQDSTTLRINTGEAEFTNDINVNGDIIGNNSDITGIDNITADSAMLTAMITNSLTGVNGTITNLSGDTISYTVADIGTLSTDDLQALTADINILTTVVANIQTANIDTANITTAVIDTATITTLTGQTLTFNDGVITSLNGVNINVTNGVITSVNTNSLATNSLVAASGIITTLTGDNLTANNASGDSISFTNGDITNIDADNLTLTANLNADQYFGGAMNLSGELDTTTVTASSLSTITNLNATSGIINGNVSANSTSAGSMVVTNGIVANTTDITSVTANSVNANNFNGGDFNGSSFNGGSFTGDNFTATDDFYTVVSSVNKNFIDLGGLQSDLDNCVNVSKYCIPLSPSASLSCPDCFDSGNRPNFSAIVSSTIDTCPQGCTYTWNISGLSGSCPSGVIAVGGSATPSCSISKTGVPNESTYIDNVSLTITNAHYPSYSVTANQGISWRNTIPGLNINDETSLNCTNCGEIARCSSGKCTATATASASVNVSNLLTGVVVVATINPSPCNEELDPQVSASTSSSASGGVASLTAVIVDDNASGVGSTECRATFTLTVTSLNTDGSAVYTGDLAAIANSF
jgi:trimeric autotransporter adhesin